MRTAGYLMRLPQSLRRDLDKPMMIIGPCPRLVILQMYREDPRGLAEKPFRTNFLVQS